MFMFQLFEYRKMLFLFVEEILSIDIVSFRFLIKFIKENNIISCLQKVIVISPF